MASATDMTRVTGVQVFIGSQGLVPDDELHTFVVDQDTDQPDMCVVTLNNASHKWSNICMIGDDIEVKVNGTSIYKGELVGMEPMYKTGGDTKLLVRSFNRLHRLLRGRNSQTFLDKKDSEIAAKIASDNGLSPSCQTTKAVHKHVYQHNQTDLEFIRVCAARNGYEVKVEDKTLYFRKPRKDMDSGLELRLNDPEAEIRLKTFTPRLSSAGIVSEVEVRAWDPEKKEEVVAKATPKGSPLGSVLGTAATEAHFSRKVVYSTDRPVTSQEEAQALADGRLKDIMMDYITGDALLMGSTETIKTGIVVKITCNPDKGDDRFNGKYFVFGCSHRYKHSGAQGGLGSTGGYTCMIRVKRDAEKG